MRLLGLAVCNLLFFCALGQSDEWYSGAVVTSDGSVLAGEIFYHPGHDLLIVKRKDNRQVLLANSVKSFRFYDPTDNINRKFLSIDNKLYEVVVAGEIPVLRKAKGILKDHPSDSDGYHYYFFYNSSVEKLSKFRAVLYPAIRFQLAEKEKEFNLDPNLPADAIRYIQLFNNTFKNRLIAGR